MINPFFPCLCLLVSKSKLLINFYDKFQKKVLFSVKLFSLFPLAVFKHHINEWVEEQNPFFFFDAVAIVCCYFSLCYVATCMVSTPTYLINTGRWWVNGLSCCISLEDYASSGRIVMHNLLSGHLYVFGKSSWRINKKQKYSSKFQPVLNYWQISIYLYTIMLIFQMHVSMAVIHGGKILVIQISLSISLTF